MSEKLNRAIIALTGAGLVILLGVAEQKEAMGCLLYTSDAADERSSVDLGGRRILKTKKK